MPYFEELIRKTIHTGSIIIPVSAVLVYRMYPVNGRIYLASALAVISIFFILFDILKARFRPFKSFILGVFGKVLRESELGGGMTAATIVFASASFTILVFRQEIAIAALVFLSLGDSSAALVGKHFGRIKLVGNRTLAGSLAALNTCLLASLAILWLSPQFGWKLTPMTLLVGAVVATLSELFDLPLDDNFRIPVFSALAMELILPG